ncbi:CPBP family intramembrane glutamic endopeptidase [Halorussus ruber]|uniref:CPBP family intramembrane glutamic endopeptidase n=1 Tax=Halorussus ruber TaxID=1126238 RepID=UPI001092B511|nr:CPBP family intramembrane glutamic endopeptidase [Halorussus ruber]
MNLHPQDGLLLAGLVVSLVGIRASVALCSRATGLRGSETNAVWKWIPTGLLLGVVFAADLPPERIGWRLYPPVEFLGYVVAGVAALVCVNVLLQVVVASVASGRLSVGGRRQSSSGQSTSDGGLTGILFVAVTAGVTEEISFRGYAIETLLRFTNNLPLAGLLSAVAFTLAHHRRSGRWISTAQIGGLAVVLTVLYLWTRSLPVVAVVHTLFDAIGLVAKRNR